LFISLSIYALALPPILRYLHENNNRVISGGCCLPLHDNGHATKAPFVNNFFVLVYNPRRPHGALPRADLHQKTNAAQQQRRQHLFPNPQMMMRIVMVYARG
jgi:hypothetical protein